MVDLGVKDRNSRGGAGGEAKERDQGDKGPNNQGKVQVVESSVAAMDKGGKKKASSNSSSRARARDRGRSPHATFARDLIM